VIAFEHTEATMAEVWASLAAIGALYAAWRLHRRRHSAAVDAPRFRGHTMAECGSSGDLVRDHLVTTDGYLVGLCPGCGASDVQCTQLDPTRPYGPWLINDHAPYVHPELGVHTGDCWVHKYRTGERDACICEGVEA